MVNERGQAAITDALIFLSIVGVLSALLITYSMQYGLDILNRVQSNYETTYLDQALKVIYVVSFGRDSKPLLGYENEEKVEGTKVPDFLMTKIKEDYASMGKLSQETKRMIFATLDNIFLMFPNKSYLFAIIIKEGQKNYPLFFGIKTPVEEFSEDETPEDKYLICFPSQPITTLTAFLQQRYWGLHVTLSHGAFYKKIIGTQRPEKKDGTIYLAIWTKQADLNILNNEDLNCKVFGEEE